MSDLRATASGKVPDPASHSEVSASQAQARAVETTSKSCNQPRPQPHHSIRLAHSHSLLTHTCVHTRKYQNARHPDATTMSMHDGLRCPQMTLMTAEQTIIQIRPVPERLLWCDSCTVIPREPYQRSCSTPDLTSFTRLSAYLTRMATFTPVLLYLCDNSTCPSKYRCYRTA